MKRTILALLVLLLLCSCTGRSLSGQEGPASSEASQTAPSAAPASEAPSESPKEESAPAPESSEEPALPAVNRDDWRLVLVNRWHPMAEEAKIDLVLPPSGTNPGRHMVDSRIVDDLEEMIAAAKKDGADLLIDYGYRSFAQSQALFEKQINAQLAAHPGYTREQAELAAQEWVAPPGTSDHHTGLALDIVTPTYQVLDDGFAETAAGRWMAEHSWEYGFVIRFPANKTEETGIAYESWHLRYVGREHAAAMRERDLCLEEYVELAS